jgi:hypothetical protein
MRRTALILLLVLAGCSSESDDPAPVSSTTTAPSTATTISFEDCQKQAEYPGGRYAVEYDNGVCRVQKP